MSPNIHYDKQDSILSMRFSKRKSVDSDIQGNIVIDYDADGKIVNIDIMNVRLEDFVPVRVMQKLAIHKV